MKEKNKSLLWGALIGSVVGSVTALLLAPKSGKELRQDIAEGARTIGTKTQEFAGKVSEQGVTLIERVKDTAGNVISDIRGWRKTDEDEEEVGLAQISSILESGEKTIVSSKDSKEDAGEL
ncbi:YtxH domain-containing protein [Paenibacillus sp. FSL W8-0194]|uniref:YtxH domain-containing protein n=1 Tax=Paenibacillus sp. FSL W8-0194 TaxID=2921711 RepID=UPI0030DCEE91